MKNQHEYPQYDMNKNRDDQKWGKRNNNTKNKEMNFQRDDKDNYMDSQYQRHPNRKNNSAYSNKNQVGGGGGGDDYDKGIQGGPKGNNQSPNIKKNFKGKKDISDYQNQGNYQMQPDDNINDKEDFQCNFKKNPQQQQYQNRDNNNSNQGGNNNNNPKGNKGKYYSHQNANIMGNNNVNVNPNVNSNLMSYQNFSNNNWEKNPLMQLGSQPQQQPQGPMQMIGGGGVGIGLGLTNASYTDKGNFVTNNLYQNAFQPQQQSNPQMSPFNPQQINMNQGQQQQYNLYNRGGPFLGDPNKQNLAMAKVNNNNNNSNNAYGGISINQQGDFIPNLQGNYTYCNTEGNQSNSMSAVLNQDKDISGGDDGEDYSIPQQLQVQLQQQGGVSQYSNGNSNKGNNTYIHDHTDTASFISGTSGMTDSIMSGNVNLSVRSAAPINNNFSNVNCGNFPNEIYLQNQGNIYRNDPMMKNMGNRGNLNVMGMPSGMFNIPQQQGEQGHMYTTIQQQQQQQQQQQYGMGNGGMTKAKKKSSKKMPQSPQDSSKGSMKMHYNNTGENYKGSHSMQGVKNTMPNHNGMGLTMKNMGNQMIMNQGPSSVQQQQNIGGIGQMQGQILNSMQNPMHNSMHNSMQGQMPINNNPLINSQGNPKNTFRQKKPNPYRTVTSDKTLKTSNISISTRTNDYFSKPQQHSSLNPNQPSYSMNQHQQQQQEQQQYYKNNPMPHAQSGTIYSHKNYDDYGNQDNDYMNLLENNQEQKSESVLLCIKIKLEKNKEITMKLMHRKHLQKIEKELIQNYNLSSIQLGLVLSKIQKALEVQGNILDASLTQYNRREMNQVSKIILKQSQPQFTVDIGYGVERCGSSQHVRLPVIQMQDPNETFYYTSRNYDMIIDDLKPNYDEIRKNDILNITQ